jgi:hypothetical protein
MWIGQALERCWKVPGNCGKQQGNRRELLELRWKVREVVAGGESRGDPACCSMIAEAGPPSSRSQGRNCFRYFKQFVEKS